MRSYLASAIRMRARRDLRGRGAGLASGLGSLPSGRLPCLPVKPAGEILERGQKLAFLDLDLTESGLSAMRPIRSASRVSAAFNCSCRRVISSRIFDDGFFISG
ncbi:putative uncharacterized protein (plasmid) [Bradyrhizobium diazoefficiens]|uniref:Uncharacterized protein n=1 Tax=Bradyrhizobium diazoefficiens TaxID=1355477 RepID=A0A0E4FZT7_9BRAD|nr:putative uncharacterized protein [Bradyrhizobium diazoefficiens]